MVDAGRASRRGGSVAGMQAKVLDRNGALAWATALGFVVAVVVLVGVGPDDPTWPARVAYTIVPLTLAVGLLVVAGLARDVYLVAAVMTALAPSLVVAVARAQAAGLLGVAGVMAGLVVAGPRIRRLDPGVQVLAAASAFVVLVAAWVVSTPAQADQAPSWRDVVGRTGASLRATVVGVGPDGRSTALLALLVWVVAVGVVVGAALLSDRPWTAAVVPAAVSAAVVFGWAVERWRGPVADGGGLWIVAAAIAFTASSTVLAADVRTALGRAVAVASSTALALGVVHQVRRAGASDLRLIIALVAASVSGSAMWLASYRHGRQADWVAGSAASVSSMQAEDDRS